MTSRTPAAAVLKERRLGVERRQMVYTYCIPERRQARDRRKPVNSANVWDVFTPPQRFLETLRTHL